MSETKTKSPSGKALTGSHLVWEVLREHGVDTVFGYPGGAIMPAYDAMPEYPIHHVLTRHEQGAAHMADGYARASGKVGVAIATSGPGATNLVTGIANAMLDSIPTVFITGQVASPLIGSDAFQEVDVSGVTLPITKHNRLVTKTEEIVPALREAFAVATSGRKGPTLVDIAKDALIGEGVLPPVSVQPALPGMPIPPPAGDEDIEKILAMLEGAKRPIILAGHGIVQSEGAIEALNSFVDKTGVPVALTLLGLDTMPAKNPLALGMMGMHGDSWVNEAIQKSDVLIAMGMRFDDRVTGHLPSYAVHAKKVHIETDPAEINKNVPVDLPVLADVGDVLIKLNAALDAAPSRISPQKEWQEQIFESRRESRARDIIHNETEGKLSAASVLHRLCQITKGEAVLVTDVGQHQMWAAQYYKNERPRTVITSGGLGTMGFALPAALGARFGRPDDEIWVIAGDGGFQMTAPELTTILQEKKKLNIAVLNNGFLGMVRQWQELFFDRRYVSTPITSPDFVKLAEAHGHVGIRVDKAEDVDAAVERARSSDQTVLIEFRVEDEDSVYPMVPAGKPIDQMIRRPLKGKGESK